MGALEASKDRPLSALIAALGIRFVGRRVAELLAERFGSMDALSAASESEIADVEGVGPVIASSVEAFFRDEANLTLVERLRERGLNFSSGDAAGQEGTELEGKSFVFTGELSSMKRAEAEALVKAHGGSASGSVSSKTSFLVAGAGGGSKRRRAEELGVPIVSEEDFLRMIGGSAPA